jgi:hydrogenase expression/formation protein HypE
MTAASHARTIAERHEDQGLAFESTIESDCAPVAGLVLELPEAGFDIHCLRDLTRGGLASPLVERAEAAPLQIVIDERHIPVHEDVQGACEILGLDPLADSACHLSEEA